MMAKGKNQFSYLSVKNRFADKVLLPDSDGCMNWRASTNKDGYGKFGLNRGWVLAHVFAYEHWVGKVPDGLEVHHKCDNRKCVAPNHLEAVTHQYNVSKSSNAKRAQTHCARGHEFSGSNLRIYSGKRYCVACGEIRRTNKSNEQRNNHNG